MDIPQGQPSSRSAALLRRARGNEPTRLAGALRARRKFLKFFPDGFRDETYIDWERAYKWQAHESWDAVLNRAAFARLLREEAFAEIAAHSVRIESRTNLLFSFEKMALRDAVKSAKGAARFARALQALLRDDGSPVDGFDAWCAELARLPRRQTRVLTWPLATVFG